MSVFIKQNNIWNEYIPTPKLVFVIVPGSGTYSNRFEYNRLKQNFNLVFFGERGCKYDNYPNNWEINKLATNKGNHLGGLCQEIIKYINSIKKIPSAIICGSRGGQVTLGKIWYSIWRGPSVIINAGCLTTNTKIPYGVKPLFITMEKDYFTMVNTPKKVHNLFNKLNINKTEKGVFIHLLNEAHMPKFENRLKGLLVKCVMYLLSDRMKDDFKQFQII
jgi:hypothetical protein